MSINPGDRAPQFTATAQTGEQVSLADFVGKNVVVLYFYPRDGTGLCSAQACGFRDAFEEFTTAGAVVIGVSRDSVERHQKFVSERRLPFLLVSDSDRAIEKAYGVPKLLGLIPGRSTFVIDKAGIVRHVFTAHFSSGKHIAEALRIVRELNGAFYAIGSNGVRHMILVRSEVKADGKLETSLRTAAGAKVIPQDDGKYMMKSEFLGDQVLTTDDPPTI